MTVNDLGEFIFKNYYKRIAYTKKDSYYLLIKTTKKKKKFSIICN